MKSHLLRAAAVAALAAALPLGAGAAARAARLARPTARPHLYHVTIGVNEPYSLLEANVFLPGRLIIHAGDSVQWTNVNGGQPQTVTFGPTEYTPSLIQGTVKPEINPAVVKAQGGHVVGDASSIHSSGALMTGVRGLAPSYTYTFRGVGVYFYRSLFHPLMLGEIDVVPSNKPASADSPDRGDSAIMALRSAATALIAQQTADAHSADIGSPSVGVGFGNKDVSLNLFSPAGLQIHVGATVTWQAGETSGDPHAIVFNPSTAASSGAPLYTGRARDGGLIFNPAYASPTLGSFSQVVTGTISGAANVSSGIFYGSSRAYPSDTSSSYTLTFMAPGQYIYVDPFHGNGTPGRINVLP